MALPSYLGSTAAACFLELLGSSLAVHVCLHFSYSSDTFDSSSDLSGGSHGCTWILGPHDSTSSHQPIRFASVFYSLGSTLVCCHSGLILDFSPPVAPDSSTCPATPYSCFSPVPPSHSHRCHHGLPSLHTQGLLKCDEFLLQPL